MNNNTGSSIGLFDVILVVNIILKLVGIINWSWLVVLWIIIIIIIIFIIIINM